MNSEIIALACGGKCGLRGRMSSACGSGGLAGGSASSRSPSSRQASATPPMPMALRSRNVRRESQGSKSAPADCRQRQPSSNSCLFICFVVDFAFVRVQVAFGVESPSLSSWYSLSTGPSFLSSLLSVIAWIRARVMIELEANLLPQQLAHVGVVVPADRMVEGVALDRARACGSVNPGIGCQSRVNASTRIDPFVQVAAFRNSLECRTVNGLVTTRHGPGS